VRTRFARLALALAVAPAALSAQAQADPHSVQPERPTVATHAYTVAPGWLEIETGVELDRFNDGARAFGVPNNVKIGLTAHAQLNVLVPMVGTDTAAFGLGDVAVGVKWRLLDRHPVFGSFALLPYLKFPSGSVAEGRGTGTTDATLFVISSRSLGRISLDLNFGYTVRSGDGGRIPRRGSFWTASLGFPVVGQTGWTFEYFGYPATSGPSGTGAWSAILTGPTATLRPWLAIDAGVIVPLTGPQTYALYAGGVWNAGQLWSVPRRVSASLRRWAGGTSRAP
jgi:hypothetical protein